MDICKVSDQKSLMSFAVFAFYRIILKSAKDLQLSEFIMDDRWTDGLLEGEVT